MPTTRASRPGSAGRSRKGSCWEPFAAIRFFPSLFFDEIPVGIERVFLLVLPDVERDLIRDLAGSVGLLLGPLRLGVRMLRLQALEDCLWQSLDGNALLGQQDLGIRADV